MAASGELDLLRARAETGGTEDLFAAGVAISGFSILRPLMPYLVGVTFCRGDVDRGFDLSGVDQRYADSNDVSVSSVVMLVCDPPQRTEEEFHEGCSLLRRAADQGHGQAALAMAYLHLTVDRDIVKVASYALKSSDAGHVDGLYLLAYLLKWGAGCPRDPETARTLALRAADGGSDLAAGELGSMMLEGAGGPVDPAGAVPMLVRGASAGHPVALASLGCSLLGQPALPGLEVNREEGKRLVLVAAQRGQREALFTAALFFLGPQHPDSRRMMERAARMNEPRAVAFLAQPEEQRAAMWHRMMARMA